MANSIIQTQDLGYLVAGSSYSNDGDVTGNHGGTDYWLVKLNSSGNFQWQKSYGGSNNDVAQSIQQTSDGAYIIAGYSLSNDGDVTGNHGAEDFWILKIDFWGNIIWEKSYGGSGTDIANSISTTSDGGYIIAGSSASDDGDVSGNNGGDDFWVIKIDSIGGLQWEQNLGGSLGDVANSIYQTNDGGYIVGGTSGSSDGDIYLTHNIINNENKNNVWVVKLDTAGNKYWEGTYGSTHEEGFGNITPTTDGGCAFIGWTISYNNNYNGDVTGAHGSYDFWTVKLSSISLINVQIPVCIQCNGHATAVPGTGMPPFTYLWSNGETSNTATQLCAGINTVTITDSLGMTTTGYFEMTFSFDFSVYMTQTPASYYSCPDGTATVHTTGGSGFHYSWDGFPDTTATLSGQPRGLVKCCVTDSLGCVICDSIEILSPLGITENLDENTINIFPNPSACIFTISSDQWNIKEIEIHNLTGELIYKTTTTSQRTTIDLSKQPQGVYFVRTFDSNGNITNNKIIIQ